MEPSYGFLKAFMGINVRALDIGLRFNQRLASHFLAMWADKNVRTTSVCFCIVMEWDVFLVVVDLQGCLVAQVD